MGKISSSSSNQQNTDKTYSAGTLSIVRSALNYLSIIRPRTQSKNPFQFGKPFYLPVNSTFHLRSTVQHSSPTSSVDRSDSRHPPDPPAMSCSRDQRATYIHEYVGKPIAQRAHSTISPSLRTPTSAQSRASSTTPTIPTIPTSPSAPA